jgi:hypothetical protein
MWEFVGQKCSNSMPNWLKCSPPNKGGGGDFLQPPSVLKPIEFKIYDLEPESCRRSLLGTQNQGICLQKRDPHNTQIQEIEDDECMEMGPFVCKKDARSKYPYLPNCSRLRCCLRQQYSIFSQNNFQIKKPQPSII